MAQQRWFNYKEDDLTRYLIRWMTGLHPEGRYFGYDFNPTADLNLNLVHSTTGFKYVDVVPAESPFLSMVMTRQGTMILEDGPITINGVSAGDPTNPRIDTIILTHERIESAGGSQALYSIIEGTPAASPTAPALTDSLRQIKLGELLIPANTTLLTDGGVVWTPFKKPTFAGGSPLDDINLGSNKAIETDASGAVIGSAVTSVELNYLTGVTSGIQAQINTKQITITGAATTVTASNLTINRALISNASGKIAVHSTVSDTELGYLNGVTSSIQTQLNALDSDKQDNITGGASTITSSNLTINRALISNASGKVAVSLVTSTELGYSDGVTSSIQTQINTKQATIVGGASTITSANLTVNRALISDGSGKVAVHSTVSDTELGYLNGVTSAVQTQLGTKADKTIESFKSTGLTSETNWTVNVKFRKDDSGRIYLRGSASKATVNAKSNDKMFTLPAGYRPSTSIVYVGVSRGILSGGTSPYMLEILTNGSCHIYEDGVSLGSNLSDTTPIIQFDGVVFFDDN